MDVERAPQVTLPLWCGEPRKTRTMFKYSGALLSLGSPCLQYKCHNTAFVPAVCSFHKSFCYRFKMRGNIRSQISAIVSILWHPLMIFLCPGFVMYIHLFYLSHHPDLVTSILPFSQWSEPGRYVWTSEPIRSSRSSSGKCRSSTLLLFLFLLTPVIIDSCVLPCQRLLPTNRRASAPDA